MATLKSVLVILACLLISWRSEAQSATASQSPPTPSDPVLVNVAFVVTDKFNLLDVAGAWEAFGSAHRPKDGKTWEEGDRLFKLYLVSDTLEPIHTIGGIQVIPTYTFKSAPKPDIVVVGAQTGNPQELYDWTKKQYEDGVTIMSVCIGAIKLARLGILDGKKATSHHDYLRLYEQMFPKIHWVHDRRYVRSTDTVYTAAGDGISGLDLALHLVDLRFGRKIAEGTADYLEYHSDEWKQDGASVTP